MSTQTSKATLTITLMILLTFCLRAAAQENAWEIGPRKLPASVDVSDVVRESLLKTPTPDVAAAKGIVFKTVKEWETWAKEGNVPSAAAARALAKSLAVMIQEDKIDGVNVHRVTPAATTTEHKKHLFVAPGFAMVVSLEH